VHPRASGWVTLSRRRRRVHRHQALGIALFSDDGGLFWGLDAVWDALPDLHDLARRSPPSSRRPAQPCVYTNDVGNGR